MNRTFLLGGRLDGRELGRKRNEPFLWIRELDDEQRSLRASAKPGKGLLYRRIDAVSAARDPIYLFAGWTHRRCEACEGIVAGTGVCGFCGGRLVAPDLH